MRGSQMIHVSDGEMVGMSASHVFTCHANTFLVTIYSWRSEHCDAVDRVSVMEMFQATQFVLFNHSLDFLSKINCHIAPFHSARLIFEAGWV